MIGQAHVSYRLAVAVVGSLSTATAALAGGALAAPSHSAAAAAAAEVRQVLSWRKWDLTTSKNTSSGSARSALRRLSNTSPG